MKLNELEPDSLEVEDPTEFLDLLWSFLDLEEPQTNEPKVEKFVNQFKLEDSTNLNDQFQSEENPTTINDQHQGLNEG